MAVSIMTCSVCGLRTKASQLVEGIHINSKLCALTKQVIDLSKRANSLEEQEKNLSEVVEELNNGGSDEETVHSMERLSLEKQVLKSSIKNCTEEIAKLYRVRQELIDYRLWIGLSVPSGPKE